MTVRMMRGDVLTRLADMPDASMHCCVSSPPYYGLRDYQVAGQIGLEASPNAYIDRMVDVFREVRRVLRPDGTLWLNLGDSYCAPGGGFSPNAPSNLAGSKQAKTHPHAIKSIRSHIKYGLKPKDLMMMPARVALALQADGWYLRSEIIWHKPNPMPESCRDRCTSAHEKIFMLSPSATYYYDAEAIAEASVDPVGKSRGGSLSRCGSDIFGSANAHRGPPLVSDGNRNRRNVWTVASQPFRGAHFATFPPALIEPCILAGTSARGVCACCGAPWVRLTARKATVPTSASIYDASRPDGMTLRGSNFVGGHRRTVGWQPSCACGAGIVPATILDPFAGAGTVGLVADRLGRHAVLIEINSDYTRMSAIRIQDDAGLFADVTYS